jgi:Ca2+-binding EF-hand superfamily protein
MPPCVCGESGNREPADCREARIARISEEGQRECAGGRYVDMTRSLLIASLVVISLTGGVAGAATPRLNQARAWDKADVNADSVLSRDEARRMPRLLRHFDAIDMDRDGTISGGEVRVWRESRLRLRGPAPDRGIDEIMRLADRNGDGTLSRAEFTEGLPRFARRFDRIDANRDGRLAVDELAGWIQSRRGTRRLKQAHQ